MVRLEKNKTKKENQPIEKIPLPAKVYIPLLQHIGKACVEQVKVGDSVFCGQKIAASDARVYAPIHASVSGKVAAITDYPHPILGKSQAIVIESDGQDKLFQHPASSIQHPDSLNPDQIREIVREAGIVGMGGASFPTHIKLSPPNPVDTLIINGAECEPYLTSDSRLMVEKTQEILQGAELIKKCTEAK